MDENTEVNSVDSTEEEKGVIKRGNIVRFKANSVYGTVVWVDGDKVYVDYFNTAKMEFVTGEIHRNDLVKVGSHPRIVPLKEFKQP